MMTSTIRLPCIFCTEPTSFPPPEKLNSPLKFRQEQEKTFRFLCDSLKIHSSTFLNFPVCQSCTKLFDKLALLQQELGRVQEAIQLVSDQIKTKVEESVQFGGMIASSNATPGLERTLEFVKAFRDKVAIPAPVQPSSAVDFGRIYYLTAVDQAHQPPTYVVTGTSTEFYNDEGGCEEITVTVSTDDAESCENNSLVASEGEDSVIELVEQSGKHNPSATKRKLKATSNSPTRKRIRLSQTACAPRKQKDGKLSIQRPPKIELNLPYKCDVCTWSFNMPHKLKLHMSTHTGLRKFKCEQCNESYKTSSSLKSHNDETHGSTNPYQCEKCDKKYILASGLRLHMGSHVEELACSICNDGKEFKSRHIWRRHMKSHDTESQIHCCCFCPLSFTRREDMIGHMTRIHRADEGAVPCNICSKEFDSAIALITHVYTHASDREVKCQGCDLTFSTRDEFRIHNEEKHGIVCPKFACDKCNLVLLSVRSHAIHTKLHKPISAASQRAIDIVKRNGPKSRVFTCFNCHQEFTSRTELRKHKLESHKDDLSTNFKCTKCVLTFDDAESLQDHIENHPPENSLICQLCDRGFHSSTSLKRHHFVTHRLTGKPFPCKHCTYSSRRKDDLKKHERLMHPADGTVKISKQRQPSEICPTPCSICGKIFPTLKGCRQHVSMYHTNPETKYECEHCGRVSKRREDLIRHLKIHVEKSPVEYLCKICDMTFKSNQNLKRHVQVIHEDIGRPYLCDLCNKSFKRKDDVYKHIGILHKKYFHNKHSHVVFKAHKPTTRTRRGGETNIKPVVEMDMNIDELKCQYCDKYLASKGFLKEHLLQHTGVTVSDNTRTKKKLKLQATSFKIVVKPAEIGEDEIDKEKEDSNSSEMNDHACDENDLLPSLVCVEKMHQ